MEGGERGEGEMEGEKDGGGDGGRDEGKGGRDREMRVVCEK